MPVSDGDGDRLRFAVLGPVRVWRGATELVIGTKHQRLLLALLLAKAGRLVEVSELVDFLWGHDIPPTAVNMVHRYVGALRRVLEPGLPPRETGRWLLRDVGGYRLVLHDSCLDLAEFRAEVTAGRRLSGEGDDLAALDAFIAGLHLWRGRCAAGLGAAVDTHPEFVAIEHEYIGAVRDAAQAALRCGGAARVLPSLRDAAIRSPFDEGLQSELLLVLAADGNQSEAIAAYGRIRGHLTEELGVEPGPELQAAYRAVISRGDGAAVEAPTSGTPVATGAAAAVPPVPPMPAVPPAQLPSDLRVFAGRAELTRDGVRLLRGQRSSLPILVFDGMPGVGKTTLAVHVAHAVAPHFPDGQLYADLRGFDPDSRIAQPVDVLQAFLGALGVGQDVIPASLDARAALYRSMVAGRQMLIVLDNARDAQQVRPLLPGTAGHAVLVTSRGRLSSLAATNGAYLRSLDVLSVDDARDCLARRLGSARIAAEPRAVEQIIERCGRLPLALAIVAARAAADADHHLTAIAQELSSDTTTLDGFTDDELERDLRTVFTWSYRLLSPEAARMLRLLSLHPGPEVTVEVAASLAGVAPEHARSQMTELVRTRLLNRQQSNRYRLHDLVRAYAAELRAGEESLSAQDEARRRLISHFLCSTYATSQAIRPEYTPIGQPEQLADVMPERFDNRAAASAWFMAERSNIRAVVEATSDDDSDACWHLSLFAKEMYTFHLLLREWEATARTALNAAQRSNNMKGMAYSHHSIAGAYHFMGDPTASSYHLGEAAELFQENGDSLGQAQILVNLGYIAQTQRKYQESIQHLRPALEVFQDAGRRDLQLNALTIIADDYRAVGDLQSSQDAALAAAQLARELKDLRQEDRMMTTLASIYSDQGRHAAALKIIIYYLALNASEGNVQAEMNTRVSLGDILYASGEISDACLVWAKLLEEMDENPDARIMAVEVRRRLNPYQSDGFN
jgi:DNA-binding SARP family transcriptional activator/tetratricopeptide (TPR) repeat protein